MGIGKSTDFVVYDEQYYGGQFEEMAQVVDVFNASSNNAITMETKDILGHYGKESFLDDLDLVSRRDITSTSSVSDTAMTADENISVKLNRRLGPLAQTLDAWKKMGANPEEMSFQLGRMAARRKLKDMLNASLIAGVAAIDNQSDLKYDATGESTATVTHAHLVSTMAKMGDRASDIVCWVMHSYSYFSLMKQALSDKIFEVAGASIYSGSVATFGRPVIVTDSPALKNDNGSLTDTYNILALTQNGIQIVESEEETVAFDLVTGLENLVYRYQGEFAFNVGVKGFQWDITNGDKNPNDTALGTGSNWDIVVSDEKNAAGALCETE